MECSWYVLFFRKNFFALFYSFHCSNFIVTKSWIHSTSDDFVRRKPLQFIYGTKSPDEDPSQYTISYDTPISLPPRKVFSYLGFSFFPISIALNHFYLELFFQTSRRNWWNMKVKKLTNKFLFLRRWRAFYSLTGYRWTGQLFTALD